VPPTPAEVPQTPVPATPVPAPAVSSQLPQLGYDGGHGGGTEPPGWPPTGWAPQQPKRPWLTPVLVAAAALLLGAAVASIAFLATRNTGGTTTVFSPGGQGTQTTSGTATTGGTPAAAGFPVNSVALQRVMDPRVLGHGQCQDTQTAVPGVPASIVGSAVERVHCQAPAARFPTVNYDVFLYPDTTTLQQQFQAILAAWQSTGHWIRSNRACATGTGKDFAGGPVKWLHPANPPKPAELAGYRACYNAAPAPLMVWTHQRNNGTLQTDHYDTLVVATSTNSGTLPTDLRDFWRYVGRLTTPIGKSLDSSPLPPLTS
jgi:hypothetical protein